MPTGDPMCPCGCGAWIGQCAALRYKFDGVLSPVTPTTEASLTAEAIRARDEGCDLGVDRCFVCRMAAKAREERT